MKRCHKNTNINIFQEMYFSRLYISQTVHFHKTLDFEECKYHICIHQSQESCENVQSGKCTAWKKYCRFRGICLYLRFCGIFSCAEVWVKGLKSPNFLVGRILCAKTFRAKCLTSFCDSCAKSG